MKVKGWVLVLLVATMVLLPALALTQGTLTLTVDKDDINDAEFQEMGAIVTVSGSDGLAVLGLNEANFEVFEEGRRISVDSATPNRDVVIAVALVVDVSGSMEGEPLENAKRAVSAFLDQLGVTDQAALVAFGGKVNLDDPFPQLDPEREVNFTTDTGRIRNVVTLLEAEGRTPLYDAAFKAIKMTASQPIAKRAVILFTDGNEKAEDTRASVLLPDDPINLAKESGVPMFTIGLGPEADVEYLRRVALLTGGSYQDATESEELVKLFGDIAERLKLRYELKWESEIVPDNATHTFEISVEGPTGFSARATGSLTARKSPVPEIRALYFTAKNQRKLLTDGQALKWEAVFDAEIDAERIIDRVEYYVDGDLLGTATEAPFAFTWKTRETDIGDHILAVRAYDDEGARGEATVSLTVVEPSFTEKVQREITDILSGEKPSVGAQIAIAFVVLLLLVGMVLLLRGSRGERRPSISDRPETQPELQLVGADVETETGSAGIGAGQDATEAVGVGLGTGLGQGRSAAETMILERKLGHLAWFAVEEGLHVGHTFQLRGDVTSIGRAGTNDIVVGDRAVSGQHAKVKMEDGKYFIQDLASTNHTFVNGEEILRCQLEDGDRVKLGGTVLVFQIVAGKEGTE